MNSKKSEYNLEGAVSKHGMGPPESQLRASLQHRKPSEACHAASGNEHGPRAGEDRQPQKSSVAQCSK